MKYTKFVKITKVILYLSFRASQVYNIIVMSWVGINPVQMFKVGEHCTITWPKCDTFQP